MTGHAGTATFGWGQEEQSSRGPEPALEAAAEGRTLRELNHQGLTSHGHCGWILAWKQLLPVHSIHTEAATAPGGSSRETQLPRSRVGAAHGHCPGSEKGSQSGPGGRKVLRQHVEGWALGQDEHCIFSCKMQSGCWAQVASGLHRQRHREVREWSRTNPAAVGRGGEGPLWSR